jgi:hypothetical protein
MYRTPDKRIKKIEPFDGLPLHTIEVTPQSGDILQKAHLFVLVQ